MALDTGHLIISNSSKVDVQYGYSSSHIEVYNSTIREWHNYYSPEVEVENSTVNGLVIGSYSVNCTIHGLKSGFFKYWNFITNCSVVYLAGGASPNVTLTNSTINNWRLAFYQASNAFITDSDVGEISAIAGSSSINIRSTQSDYLYADNLATLQADNSTIGTLTTYETAQVSIVHSSVNSLQAHGSSAVWFNTTSVSTVECSDSSKSWLLNSTYSSLIFHDSGTAYIAWYLTVHILDMISQDVPSANITAIFENSTTATTAKTNINGTVTLALAEKAINITGEYSFANYTVTAAYDTYTNQTWVNMTANQQATLVLGFILPEFQSLIMVFALMTATILIVTFNTKRRRKLT
jgi:5-hydroxyisourate hydrolase-like protein (transthyretin family)